MRWRGLLSVLLFSSLQASEVALWWRADPGAAGGLPTATEVAGPFVYDGLTRSSFPNAACAKTPGRVELSLGLRSGSFTVELLLKPGALPKADAWVLRKERILEGVAGFRLGVQWLAKWKQAYYAAALDRPGQEAPEPLVTGHYVTSSRLRADCLAWTHLALVYDEERSTLAVWQDHWLQREMKLTGSLTFDDAPLVLGEGLDGLVDEVRVVKEALRPARFLRARSDRIDGVDLASPATVLPPASGYLDLREHFGAIGNGAADDTAALVRAFELTGSKVPAAFYTLYLPPGTYLVSGMLHQNRFSCLQGAGPGRSVIRLKDRCPGFQDPAKPQPVIRASSCQGPPGANKDTNGSSIGIYLFALTIDTGSGNPGAKGIEYHANNHGCLGEVEILSGDGAGVLGLDLTHKTVGPALVQDVQVRGFDIGAALRYAEYSMTFERVRFSGQRKCAIRNEGNILALRRISSTNSCPAIISTGGGAMVSLLESDLVGGDPKRSAIESEGALYARTVRVAGYGHAISRRSVTPPPRGSREQPKVVDMPPIDGDIDEFVGEHAVQVRGGGAGSLRLPVEEPPILPSADPVRDWAVLSDFAHLRGPDGDWTPALQAAVDCGRPCLVIPQGSYPCAGTVRISGRLRRLVGMHGQLVRPELPDKEAEKERSKAENARTASDPPPPALLEWAEGDPSAVLSIERLGLASLRHASPGTLIIRHGQPGSYANAPEAGRLFLENVMGHGWRIERQRVWCRQWNPEAHGPGPCIINQGGTVWSLGFKTEYESSKLWASGGASTEILGGFIYPVVKGIPDDRPVFRNQDSAFSAIYGMSIYTAGHKLQLLDLAKGRETRVTSDQMRWIGARGRMDLLLAR